MIFIHGVDMSIQLSTASKDLIQWSNAHRANTLIRGQQPLPTEFEKTVEGCPDDIDGLAEENQTGQRSDALNEHFEN